MTCEEKFDGIVRLKNKTLADLGKWSDAQLRYKPSATEWSALEIVDHLARTDASITAQMRANADAPLPLSLRDRMAGAAFNKMFRSPVRVKTPGSASGILPQGHPDLATAAAVWDRSLAALQSFLEGLPAEPAGAVFRHPVAGPMSLATALDFLETHTRHHLHQLARVRRAAEKSA